MQELDARAGRERYKMTPTVVTARSKPAIRLTY